MNYIFARYDELMLENEHLQAELRKYKTWMPPGHFYSPIPDLEEVCAQEEQLFDRSLRQLAGIDLREKEQFDLLKRLLPYYKSQPFSADPQPGRRYYFDNPHFCYADALYLQGMIHLFQPQRIIDVGSGYSSAIMLDTNELFFDGQILITHIDPYPDLLERLLLPGDLDHVDIRPEKLQFVPLDLFAELKSGDILFVDSTHVSKAGSDVNHLFFEILPRLQPGVLVHLHDIFFPFEYRREWLAEGRAWNEAYMLRAFLQYNDQFQIVLFSSFLAAAQSDWLAEHIPLCLRAELSSIWLERRGEKP